MYFVAAAMGQIAGSDMLMLPPSHIPSHLLYPRLVWVLTDFRMVEKPSGLAD
jgi:hypothetical protein